MRATGLAWRVTLAALMVVVVFVLAYVGLLPAAWRDVSAVVGSVWQHIVSIAGEVI